MDLASLTPFMETLSEGIVAVSFDLQLLSSNKAAREILGPGCEGLIRAASRTVRTANHKVKSLKQTISAVKPVLLDDGPLIPLGTFKSDGLTPFSEHDLPAQRALQGESVDNQEIFIRNRFKEEGVRIIVNAKPIKDETGNLVFVILAFRDVSDVHASEQRQNIFRQVFAQTQEAIVIMDSAFNVQYANQAYFDLTGEKPESILNRQFSPGQESIQGASNWQDIKESLATEGRWSGEFVLRKRSNELLPLWATLHSVSAAANTVTNHVLTLADLTSLKSTQEELYRLLTRDPITGLANRREFFEQLEKVVEKSKKQDKKFGLFFLDLQRFKELNDSLGHQAGDQMLKEVAARLQSIKKENDALARLGGDEFAILVSDCASELDLAITIERIQKAVESPLSLNGHQITPNICIGAAVFPNDGTDAETLARNTDTALTAATSEGEANTQLYTHSMNAHIIRHFWVENNLRNSFGTEQLVPFFQPQLNLENMKPEEAEILIRWKHPKDGLINPGEFIPVAERSGLINRVTAEVLSKSCKFLLAWKKLGMPLNCVALNVSANLLLEPNFITGVYNAIEEHQLSPKDILIEITESSAMADPERTSSVLKDMKKYGLTLAIDDFGTGYSSLAYLHKFAVDQVKIDQSFVKDIERSQESRTIVKAIVRMCEALGFETLAEGVETKGQAQILQELGCKKLQGYLISKALSPEEYEAFMRRFGNGMNLR